MVAAQQIEEEGAARERRDRADRKLAAVEQRLPEYNTLLLHNHIFQERTCGIGVMDADTVKRWGVTGPALRAAGIDFDCRRDAPYSVYDRFDFEIPSGESGIAGEFADCFQRHWIRIRDRKIENYQLVVPSTWNASPRDAQGQRSAYEESLVGTPVHDTDQPLEILRTIHSFDPCIACAVHLYDPDGKQLHRVSFQ